MKKCVSFVVVLLVSFSAWATPCKKNSVYEIDYNGSSPLKFCPASGGKCTPIFNGALVRLIRFEGTTGLVREASVRVSLLSESSPLEIRDTAGNLAACAVRPGTEVQGSLTDGWDYFSGLPVTCAQ